MSSIAAVSPTGLITLAVCVTALIAAAALSRGVRRQPGSPRAYVAYSLLCLAIGSLISGCIVLATG